MLSYGYEPASVKYISQNFPGRPQNIRVTPTSANTATAKWDPPKKNAEVVELYRILWRAQGSVKAKKVDTSRYLTQNI